MNAPTLATMAKVGSILVHVEEGRSQDGHDFDWAAVDALMADDDVQQFLKDLSALALLPRKRR